MSSAMLVRSASAFTSFTNLDDDTLGLIIEQILLASYQSVKRSNPWALKGEKGSLLNLSTACKQIRASVAPWLFHELTWPGNRLSVTRIVEVPGPGGGSPKARPFAEYPVIPDPILSHVRRLIIRCHRKYLPENLLQSLQKMTSLASIVFDCKFLPPLEVLEAITHLPSVVGVEFLRTPLDFQLSSYEFPHLEQLCLRPASGQICVNNGPTSDAATLEVDRRTMKGFSTSLIDERKLKARFQNSAEAMVSKHIILANISSLQRIEIDGSLVPWYEFEKMEWPCLHTLILLGSPPENLPRPFVSFLRGMNHLADLQFRWVVGKKDHPFCILPNSSSFDLSTLFPALTSLTISNPTSSDHCYAHLPSGLKHLLLPVVCPKGETNFGLLSNDAREIIHSIAAGRVTLITLRFSLQCFTPPEIIQDIAQTLPMLQNLEIGTMYNHLPPNTAPWDDYANAFSPLQHLRELRIAPQLKSNGRPGYLGPNLEEMSLAVLLAKELPALQSVALQSLASTGSFLEAHRSDTWNHWTTYEVVRRGLGPEEELVLLCDGDMCEIPQS